MTPSPKHEGSTPYFYTAAVDKRSGDFRSAGFNYSPERRARNGHLPRGVFLGTTLQIRQPQGFELIHR